MNIPSSTNTTQNIIVTGGAGFIGSALVRFLLAETQHNVLTLDKLTYAGNLASIEECMNKPRHTFVQADICDRDAVENIFKSFKPSAIMHLAAESHVDRSIDGPGEFLQTNIIGTYILLEACRKYIADGNEIKFQHISTDEVFGDLEPQDLAFTEETPYDPRSPYSASKASSDHLVRAWANTYKIPSVITNCSNNYGPYHFPEKMIPLMILNALDEKPLPVYGDGKQVRDWLYVEDHVKALYSVLLAGESGQTYAVGGINEKTNLEVVHTICDSLDNKQPRKCGKSYRELITFVTDRPGHDRRYAINPSKIQNQLGWQPEETFESGIAKTIDWFLQNRKGWCNNVLDGNYNLQRLGCIKDGSQ